MFTLQALLINSDFFCCCSDRIWSFTVYINKYEWPVCNCNENAAVLYKLFCPLQNNYDSLKHIEEYYITGKTHYHALDTPS